MRASEGRPIAVRWLRNHTPPAVRHALAASRRFFDTHVRSDKSFVERQYVRFFGKMPDLAHPRTFNEKVEWRKLYDRRPLYQLVTDKLAMRDYVADLVGPDYLVPMLGVFEKPEDIPWDELPPPYVVKATHGCDWNLFVFDSAEADPGEMTRILRGWLKTNYFYRSREWAYKHIPRKIIVERFIGTGRQAPEDFKFFCFDGVPKVIHVLQDRFTDLRLTWYDTEWTSLPFRGYAAQAAARPAPSALPEMLAVAGKLSADFDFVRVDLYCVDGRVYCGELTLYPLGGVEVFRPPEVDEWLGGLWKLRT